MVALRAAVRQVTAAAGSPGGPVSVVVVATITPSEGSYDEVRQILLDAIPLVHAEPGCERYSLHEDGERFVMIEKWESAEALETHSNGEVLRDAGRAMAGKLAGKLDVRSLSAVPAGDAAKGAL
jgi:quinol monooxygenase YgiN